MANLQQCLLYNSAHHQTSRHSRRRRKRNKAKKASQPLNNSLINEISLERLKKIVNANSLFRSPTPEVAIVKPIPEKSDLDQTIDLCSDESQNENLNEVSNENLNSTSSDGDKSCMIMQQKEDLIDLCADTPDENEVMILPNDESKPPKHRNAYITYHNNKPSNTQSPNLKTSYAEPANDRTPRNVLHNSPDDLFSFSEPPEGINPCIIPEYEQPNTKPPYSRTKSVILHSGTENKSPTNKPPDTQSYNWNSPNAEPAINRPSKSVFFHNIEDTPTSRKPPEYERPNARPATNKPKCVLLLSKSEGISFLNQLPETQSSNSKSHKAKAATSSTPRGVLHSKPPETQSSNSKSLIAEPAINRSPNSVYLHRRCENESPLKYSYRTIEYEQPNIRTKSVILHSMPENKSPPYKPSDTQFSNLKSPNTKPATTSPRRSVLHSRHEDKSPSKLSETQSYYSKSVNAKPATTSPRKSVLHSRPEDKSPSKPPETQSFNSKSPNAKPATYRVPKSALLHSRPEDKSPLSKPSEKKRPSIKPYECQYPITKPANSSPHGSKSETVVIDISDDGGEGDLDLNERNDSNDEILVLGTFNNKSKQDVVPPEKHSKKDSRKLTKDQPRRSPKENHSDHYTERRRESPRPRNKERRRENSTQESYNSVRRQEASDSGESSGGRSDTDVLKLRRRIKAKYFKKMLQYKKKMEVDLFDTIKYGRLVLDNKLSGTELASKVGGNIYINSPVYIPTKGLRPIMIDGSNVAFTSENQYKFSCKRLNICIKYFKEKGHKVTAFVPQFRVQSHQSDDPGLLDQLVRSGDVVLTPSKVIDGKLIVPYDDRFIVQAAVLKGGIIISRDNYKDLLDENPSWADTIKYRTLAYTWVDDVLMFPSDPLGVIGPSLEEFLRFG